MVLCRFSDLAGTTPRPPQFYEAYFTQAGAGTGGAYDYWLDVTYGNLTLEGSRVFGWLDMTHTSQELAGLTFPGDRATLWQWGADTALAAGIDLSPFSVVVVVLNTSTDHGSAGGNRVVFGYAGTTWEPTFVLHEMGHALGLDHSWSANPDTVYGDRWDIMSAMNVWTFTSNYGAPAGPGVNAPYLTRLGAIPASRVWTATAARPLETVPLAALSEPQAPGYLTATVPPKFLGPGQNVTYFFEFRCRQRWDKGIPSDTVLVHEVRANGLSFLLSPQLVPGLGTAFSTPGGDLRATVSSVDSLQATATITIQTRPATEPPRCQEIRNEIVELEGEIASLQEDLQTAAPGEKPFIAAQIRRHRNRIAALGREAAGLGCGPLP